MTIDHPDSPNVALTEDEDLAGSCNTLPVAATASCDVSRNVNDSRRNGSFGSSSCQSSDSASEETSPPPVPPRPPETLSCDSTPPDSPFEVWPTFPVPNSGPRKQPVDRQSSWQLLRPEVERMKQLRRFSASTRSSWSLPHAPLRPYKSAAERPQSRVTGKGSRTLSEGANKLKQSISSLFHRKSSNGKDNTATACTCSTASPVDTKDVEELEKKLIHDLFPNSGEIQFVKSDEPPPPLPPRNWETAPKEMALTPRNWQKNKRTRTTHRWGASSSS